MISASVSPSPGEKSLPGPEIRQLVEKSPLTEEVVLNLLEYTSIRERAFLLTAVPFWRDEKWVLLIAQSDDQNIRIELCMCGLIWIHLHMLNGGYITNSHHEPMVTFVSFYASEQMPKMSPDTIKLLLASINDQRSNPTIPIT